MEYTNSKMKNMNVLERFKALPKDARRTLSIGIIFFFVIGLPFLVWAITHLNFNPFKKAASGEPGVCVVEDKTITVTPASDINGTCHNIQTAIDAVPGDGYIVRLTPGDYPIDSTIRVSGKSNIIITGDSAAGTDAVRIHSQAGGGWGILVENSSGSIQWLSLIGGSSNGMLSIHNSNNFSVGYTYLNSQTSHTVDIQSSTGVSLYNSEIESSAGAVEVMSSNSIGIMNNVIHNSANALVVYNTSDFEAQGNLIYQNREKGIALDNVQDARILHNSILFNAAGRPSDSSFVVTGNSSLINLGKNIIAFGGGPGVKFEAETITRTVEHNDVFSNYTNYVGITPYTGINGNISADPLLNASQNYCLMAGSPALYGNIAIFEYMGYIGQCSTSPSPSPTPRPPSAECEICGGFAGFVCQTGLTCQMSGPTHPDQAGICVRPNGTSQCGATPTPNANPPICGQSTIPPATGNAPLTVTLHGAGSSGQGTGIVGYRWDFENDGTWDTGIDIDPVTHTYTQPGTYNPVFQVRNTNGIYSSVCAYGYQVVASGSTPPPTVRPITILLKLQGVDGDNASFEKLGLNAAKVTVRFLSSKLNYALGYITSPVRVDYQGNGIYALHFGIWSTELPAANDYALILKGEKHVGTKFCTANGQRTHCLGFEAGKIVMPTNPLEPVSLDFTGIALPPGDLFPQDGVVDINDFNKLKSLLSKPCASLTVQDKLVGDLDYSGCVNARDILLLRQTLQTRYDDN